MTIYIQDADFTLHHGDCLDVLHTLPDASVHMCATSPPFHSLRDYGVDGQIGLEDSINEWVARLVEVFAEVKRVLRDDATLWLELGDSFTDKQLVGQPWQLAFALQRAGWFLRSEIIWARPNPMPESVTDRPTKAHSTVFLLAKRPRYFFDADAIREAHAEPWRGKGEAERNNWSVGGTEDSRGSKQTVRLYNPAGANARSVWTIPTEPTPFAHFATWPQKLVARMILAGTSERGVCPECGAPWERETASALVKSPVHGSGSTVRGRGEGTNVNGWAGESYPRLNRSVTTLGWRPSCAHGHQPIPATILDPFAGSGTTNLVARRLQRHSIGIELNADYCALAAERMSQQTLLTELA